MPIDTPSSFSFAAYVPLSTSAAALRSHSLPAAGESVSVLCSVERAAWDTMRGGMTALRRMGGARQERLRARRPCRMGYLRPMSGSRRRRATPRPRRLPARTEADDAHGTGVAVDSVLAACTAHRSLRRMCDEVRREACGGAERVQ